MKKISILMAAAALVVLTSCISKKPVVQTASYFNQTTECLGKQLDGTQLLKVYAKGVDRVDAVREAKKKAIEEVLFKGITAGDTECSAYPIVDAPNARQKHEPMPVRNTRTISTSSLRTAATSRSMLTRLTKTCVIVSRVLARRLGVSWYR